MPVIQTLKDAIAYLNDEVDRNIERCLPDKQTENMIVKITNI